MSYITTNTNTNITNTTICGNYFTQHIPLHIPRRSLNKPKPICIYNYDLLLPLGRERERERESREGSEEATELLFLCSDLSALCLFSVWCLL